MELNVSTLAMKLKTIRMREKEITLSLNRIHINMRIMSMNSLLQDMMPSIIMIDRLHLDELISMRAPTKTLLEGDATIGKFIRNIHGPLIFNCSPHIISAPLLTFPLVHIPPVCGPVTLSGSSFILMDPCISKPHHLNVGTSREGPTCAAREAIGIVDYYETYVHEDDKVMMSALEDEVLLVHEFKEDSEVDLKVGRVIPDLGCTKSRNSKFFHTLELFWHVKTMIVLDMLSKDEYFHQLKGSMEMLEIQMEHMSKVISWSARKHKGLF
jgi:hypothetical protein